MTVSMYCRVCRRTVHLEVTEPLLCPVCFFRLVDFVSSQERAREARAVPRRVRALGRRRA